MAGLTGVPLIPVYTANIRLAYRAVCLGSLLEVTRLPLVGSIYRKYNDISSVWVYSVKYSARWVENVFFPTLNYKY